MKARKKNLKIQNRKIDILVAIKENPGIDIQGLAKILKTNPVCLTLTGKGKITHSLALRQLIKDDAIKIKKVSKTHTFYIKEHQVKEVVLKAREGAAFTPPQDFTGEALMSILDDYFKYHLGRLTTEMTAKIKLLEGELELARNERNYFEAENKKLAQSEAKTMFSWMK